MKKTPKEPFNSGLHAPNAFLVPLDTLEIANKLTKEGLLTLLALLGNQNKYITAKGLAELHMWQIADMHGNLIFHDTNSPIKLTKATQTLYTGIGNEPIDIDAIFAELPDNAKKLWGFYAGWLRDKGIPITGSHKINWTMKMKELVTNKNFDETANKAYDMKIGTPKWIEVVMKNINAEKPQADFSSWENSS